MHKRDQPRSRSRTETRVAQSLCIAKELHGKDLAAQQDMIIERGQNWNNYPTEYKRGTFTVRDSEGRWFCDKEAPILTQARDYVFKQVPLPETVDAAWLTSTVVR